MKKTLALLFILLLLLLCACVPEVVQSGGRVVHDGAQPDMPEVSAQPDPDITGDDIVYVTQSGSKYHKEDCSFLKKSKIPVTLEQAEREGKTPCSRCFPDD